MSKNATNDMPAHVHRTQFWRELGQLGRFALTEGIRAAAGKMDTASLIEALDAGVLDEIPDAGERMKSVLKAATDYGGKLLPVLDKWLERYKEASYAYALRENEPPQYVRYAAGVLHDLAETKDANAIEVIRIFRKHGADPFFEEPNFQTYRSCAADRAFGAGRPLALAALLEGYRFTEDNPLPPLRRAQGQNLLHYATKLGSVDKAQYSACVRVICEHLDPAYRRPYHELYDETLKGMESAMRSVGVPTYDRVTNLTEMLIIGAAPDDPSKWANITTPIVEGKLFFPAEVLRNVNEQEPEKVFAILLNEAGLSPDAEFEGARLLHMATYHNRARVVEMLLAAGADHGATTLSYNEGEDKTPKTARDLALGLNYPQVAQMIDAYAARSAIASVLGKRPAP